MILASLVTFIAMLRLVMSKVEFNLYLKTIATLSLIVVVLGMVFGRFGAMAGLPWWIYYPVPMLTTVILPPLVLKLNIQKTIAYLILSFLSDPFIHVFFSLFLGWTEYMPFWKIPFASASFESNTGKTKTSCSETFIVVC